MYYIYIDVDPLRDPRQTGLRSSADSEGIDWNVLIILILITIVSVISLFLAQGDHKPPKF